MITNKKLLISGIAIGIVLSVLFYMTFGFLKNNLRFSAAGGTMAVDEKIRSIYKILDSYYVNDYDRDKIEEGIYSGMVSELGDPYSVYMDANTLLSFQERMNGSYSGIGVVVSVDTERNLLKVLSPIEGTPAFSAGIMPGDYIIKIDGNVVSGDKYNEAVESIKGKPGTAAVLTVFRESGNETFDLEIIRAKIDLPTVSHKMLSNDIGYIRIISFDEVTTEQFRQSLETLSEQEMRSLIIDLRNNPGGILKVVCDIADMLVDAEYIVYTEDKKGQRDYTYASKGKIEVPLVVLVNENSASASEVLSGAIKDTGAGVLVGETTFGKGLVQSIKLLPDGSGIKVTIAKYYTPSGVCIDGEGILPDYKVEMDAEREINISNLSQDEDIQLKKAVEVATFRMALGHYPND